MKELKIKDLIKIFALNTILSLLFFIMIEAIFAQVFVDFLLNLLDQQMLLLCVVLGLNSIALIVSLLVSLLVTEQVRSKSIFISAGMAYASTFLAMLFLSYASLFLRYPSVFEGLEGAQILLVFPQVMVYFAVYCTPSPIWFFVFTILIYSLLFISFLAQYHEYKPIKYKKRGYER